MFNWRGGFALVCVSLAVIGAADSLRVATWNVSNYRGTDRAAAIQTAVYGSFQGRSMSPDVIFGQEIQSAGAAAAFVNALNGASGGPGDWAVTFGALTGTSVTSDTAMFYRTSRVNALNPVLVAAAGGTSANPRDVWRFDFTVNGNAGGETLSAYNVHMKAGTGTTDQDRREVEAQLIRSNANGLGSGNLAMVVGDLNIQSSSQTAYQTLTSAGSNSRGQVFDPIGSPGSWNNSASSRFLHTQDPSSAMDDRFDQLLLEAGFDDGFGIEYAGSFGTAYSTTTWDDANHSYRVWGNDGTSFDSSLTVNGNTMVGSTVAQALLDTAGANGGHLPVYLDLNYSAVPEPATMAIIGVGLVVVARRRKKA